MPGGFFGLSVKLIVLEDRFAGQFHTQALEGVDIHIGQHDGGVSLTAVELGQLIQSLLGVGVCGGCIENRGSDKKAKRQPWRSISY